MSERTSNVHEQLTALARRVQELSSRDRAALGAAGLVAAGLLSGCSSVDHNSEDGVKTGNITYYANGTRAYDVTLPVSDGKKVSALERCQDNDTLETSYVDDGGALKAVTAQHEPVRCADGKLTPDDFAADAPASPSPSTSPTQ